jgi:NADH dehydrogenase
MMNPFVEKHLQGKVALHDKTHGIVTNDRLRAKRPDGSVIENVHAIGDCAIMENAAYPATAQVASQKANWLAKRLNKGDLDANGFTYKNLGVMAYIGNWNAIMQTDGGDISGRVAWFIWRGAYLAKSVSWRNRVLIPVYWFVNWVFGRDISRF